MQYRNINSLRSLFDGQKIIGVFASAKDANAIESNTYFRSKESGEALFDVWVDRRRPENSIEIYFEDQEKEFKERRKEQNEFDKIFN